MAAPEFSVNLRYYALLREQRGVAAETVVTAAATAGELYRALSGRHGFTLPAEQIRVAINDRFCALDDRLAAGDTVVFVPPVAGG